jgi:hypothetical protein
MASQVIELARREGAAFRSVRLALEEDGALTMETQDMRSTDSGIWGDDDDEYEFWVRVAPPSLPKLAFELLREKFAGQLDAGDRFREWCKAHGIEHKFDSWL